MVPETQPGAMRARLAGWLGAANAHAAAWMRRLRRRPRPLRWALGGAFILGGLLSFLPVLGLWMLPVGLVVLSDDAAWLRRPRRLAQVRLLRRVRAARGAR